MRKPKRSTAAVSQRKPTRLALRDPRLKKIYVYAEGTFVLHNAAEVHKIVIKTPAFDVAGWIDLSSMAPGGDELFTEVHVTFANRTNVLYQRTVFDGPRLITLSDITNGQGYLSGTTSKSGSSRPPRTTISRRRSNTPISLSSNPHRQQA